mmetsp:Transcript_20161/g.17320  ORF Transcript_20161/g.17320 Transcript_20161/m.17320 type:complete len:84 (+) Transcript_20161:983-1234(+)
MYLKDHQKEQEKIPEILRVNPPRQKKGKIESKLKKVEDRMRKQSLNPRESVKTWIHTFEPLSTPVTRVGTPTHSNKVSFDEIV